MATLGHLMVKIEYNPQLGIWAKSLSQDSPARIGQISLENGGVNDEWQFISNGESLGDSRFKYTNGDPDFDDEWINDYLSEIDTITDKDTSWKL